ncbi:hypothetical protein SS1G_14072 [Sclerotinia sclerotiorum 1980 UF-70]|uniref:Heterokaryon incompatibility domain-containing protein n=2 Tax=Sclerotinia sclerotiorum (strain ATCC 18683 / 1980 / Ss-1) TaxID=665079 RepID=A7F8Z1_SCLS1|nr:hypothetical protein SS1G_14072 [Sclerotinia sclerotiorum 1980 UF-70]APA13169.1 hypothetical protein sscle_10g079390 [Sclerotinia sclerotiorum 1980 UF-70]EDN99212.1 hypothetical protein SS1G_14072 [Sclerotinia sclerotiorum 1980 UF-70]
MNIADLCPACSKLNITPSSFTSDPYQGGSAYQLGSYNDLLIRDTCPLCLLLVETSKNGPYYVISPNLGPLLFLAFWKNAAPEDVDETPNGNFAVLSVSIYSTLEPGSLQITLRPINSLGSEYLHYAKDEGSSFIDFDLVRGWMEGCEKNHKCGESFTSLTGPYRTPAEFKCIDVEQMCIVEPPEKCRYITLSYVWGTGKKFVALKENYKHLSTPGGLTDYLGQLSRTIQDAIDVTKRLRERYLWIDSLCITQDGLEEKQKALEDMGLVYSQALLMICAADDRCPDDGLSGLNVPRKISQHKREIMPGLTLAAQYAFEPYVDTSIYNSRGWTYQEEQFSSRMIVFINDQIYFRCTSAVCSEVVVSDTGKNQDQELKQPDTIRRLIGRKNTSLSVLYFRAVETYTARNLTYPSDIINALAGVLNTQGNAMDCDIFYGLPSAMFDLALLWQPCGKVTRREGFPSWSWAGWQGQVRWSGDTMEMASYGLYGASEYLEHKKITTWLLNQTWIDWYRCIDGKVLTVWSPKGQSIEILQRECQSIGPTKEAVGYSTFNSSPTNLYGRTKDNKVLLAPDLPIVPLQSTLPTLSDPQYLYFSTISVQYRIRPTTAYLRYGSIGPPWDPTHRTIYHLLNNTSQVCGYILLPSTFQAHYPNQFQPIPPIYEADWDNRGTDTEPIFEFLLLSKANYYCDWNRPHEAHPYRKSCQMEDYMEIHIMMVKTRNDGVMERMGIGRLHEDAIRDACGEGAKWKDVVLG